MGHLRPGDHIIQSKLGMPAQLSVLNGSAGKLMTGGRGQPLTIDLLHLLHHFKQPCPPGQAILLQRRRHRQTDGFFRPFRIGHHQVGGQRIQPAFHAFHGGIKGFQINGHIRAKHPFPPPFLSA